VSNFIKIESLRKVQRVLWGILRETDDREDPGILRMTILKSTFEKYHRMAWDECKWFRIGTNDMIYDMIQYI